MKFDFCSDTHEDFYYGSLLWQDLKNPESDTLILAGDVSNDIEKTAEILFEAKKHYNNVAFIDGNHDNYNIGMMKQDYKSVSENMNYLFTASIKDGWTYLPFRDLKINDTVIIGVNGWYSFDSKSVRYTKEEQYNAWKTYMSDSRVIKFDKAPDILAEEQANYLFDKVSQYNDDETIKNIVITTHTLPIEEALIIKTETSHADIAWNQMSGSFVNTNMKKVWMNNSKEKIKIWTFGHTHYPKSIVKNNINFEANPRGYPTEQACIGYKFKQLEV